MTKSSGVAHRALKVSTVTGLSTALSIILQLVSVPVCLKYWGKEAYGMWLTVIAAFMLLRTIDGGYTAYVGNKINLLYHADRSALSESLASAVWGVTLLGALQLLIAGVLVGMDGVFALFPESANNSGHGAGVALLVLVGTWVLTGPYLGIVHRLMIPAGMMYQSAWWSMGFQVTQFVAIMVAAVMQLSLLKTSVMFACIQSFIYLASAVYIRNKLPEYFPWWRSPKFSIGVSDLSKSTLLTLSSVLQQGTTNALVVLVSALGGAASVATFTTVRTLANLWTNVSNILTTPLLPDVVRYHAKREGEKLLAMNQAHWVLVGTVVNLGILLSFPLIGTLYGYWINHSIILNQPLLCLLLAGVAVANAGALMNLYLNGINNLKIVFLSAAIRSVCGLMLGWYLFSSFGFAGLGGAILFGELAVLFIMLISFSRTEIADIKIGALLINCLPTSLSLAVILIYLGIEATGANLNIVFYVTALFSIMATALWGWISLDAPVKNGFIIMFTHLTEYGKQ